MNFKSHQSQQDMMKSALKDVQRITEIAPVCGAHRAGPPCARPNGGHEGRIQDFPL